MTTFNKMYEKMAETDKSEAEKEKKELEECKKGK